MSEDVPFTPRLGKPRDVGHAGNRRFSSQLKKAVARAGKAGKRKPFTGARIGRGSAAGRAVSFRRHPFAKFRMRRVIVKVHMARASQGIGKAAFKAHLKYIQRDGVDREGHGGKLYGAERDRIEDKDFIARSEDDKRQFRLIVSPEDSDQFGDLKENTRAFMAQMEKDLGTRLDWVAVDHHNTGHPHTHIVIRGKDARGKDLVIAREYLAKGMRQRACEIATERLGPRRDLEIARAQANEVTVEGLTGLDRVLAGQAKDNQISVLGGASSHERLEQSLLKRRLAHLQKLGLAETKGKGAWRLTGGWQDTLKAMGRRGDKIRQIAAASRDGETLPRAVYEPSVIRVKRLLGRVVADGPGDEVRNGHYLIVDGAEGTRWHVSLGERLPGTLPPPGAIVEISPAEARPKQADRIIARIAALQGGHYSGDLHADADPAASRDYRQAHIRRLEALRRTGLVEREADGVFRIPEDYLKRAADYEAARSGGVRLEVKSWIGLADQIERPAPTWLDDTEIGEASKPGFGREAAAARRARREFLRERGWLNEAGEMSSDHRARLASGELARAARKYGGEKTYVPMADGGKFSGVYERPVDLAPGRYALVAKSREFTLVPWRPELERHRGASISIRKTTGGIDWTVGKTRGIGR